MATITGMTASATTAALALKADTATVTSQLAMKADLSAAVLKTNNLSDLSNLATARTNLNLSQRLFFDVRDYGATGNGTTDDYTAINNAITACDTAGGGVVYFPHGTYSITQGLTIWNDNVVLAGETKGSSIIKPVTGFSYDVINTPIPGTSGSSGYTQTYLGVENLTLDCSNMTGTTNGRGNGIHFYGVRYSHVRDLIILNCPNWGIVLDGDATNTSYSIDVRDNYIDGGAAGLLLCFSDLANIVDNTFAHANATTAATEPIFSTPSNVGYLLRLMSVNGLVQGNVFQSGGSYTSPALEIETAGSVRVIGNRFDRCRYQAIKTSSNNTIIQGNEISNPSSVGSVEGITLAAGTNLIIGNDFNINSGAAHYTYCISESVLQSNNIIQSNRFVVGTSGAINLNAGSTGNHVFGNPGYNPVGHITSPTVPTTGTGFTNKFGVDATVHIFGGTVTGISIGGTLTGVTSGTFRVPSAQTVAIAYSAVPTWNWFLD